MVSEADVEFRQEVRNDDLILKAAQIYGCSREADAVRNGSDCSWGTVCFGFWGVFLAMLVFVLGCRFVCEVLAGALVYKDKRFFIT